MAPRKKAATEPVGFEDDEHYEVRLKRQITYAGRMISPAARLTMKGKIAKQFKDDISHARKIDAS